MPDEHVVESLAQFADFIETTFTDQSEVLFRGQRAAWPLLPSIARYTPTFGDALAVENMMLEELQRLSVPYLATHPQTPWDWIALAQHHGLPTRLIDWSLNPLASLWFAVHEPPASDRDGVLWVLRPEPQDFATMADKMSLHAKRHTVFAPRHITGRITAQGAWFTVHKGWKQHPAFEALEDSPEFGGRLTKLTIPRQRFAHLRFNLDRYGVNNASVFPDLDGLCKHLKWKYFYVSDEGPSGRI